MWRESNVRNTVYMPPTGSVYYEDNYTIREQLEQDIRTYKTEWIVLVVGDLNSRIGTLMTIINEDTIYKRQNADTVENDNGRELIKLMNSVGMVILSGIGQTTKFTCYKEGKWKRGKSVVDHICIDEGALHMVQKTSTKEDVMNTMKTDHAMITMELTMKKIENKIQENNDRKKGKKK